MSDTVIQVEGVSKQYRLGEVGTGSLRHDFNRWWHKIQGKEDPYSQVGETNDRTKVATTSDYVWVLKDINFEVKQGEVLGVIGRNGAGKSTLLKLLSRVTSPTGGEIKIKGRIASLLEVGTGFNPELTGRDNIYLNGAILGMRKREIDRKFDEIVAFAEVERYIDTPVKRYSSGMYVRLAFAVAAHLEPEILIVDEVLAVGDAEFQKKCLGKMQDVAGHGRTILFVSHNMSAVQRLCSRALLLKQGTVQQIGPTNAVLSDYLASGAEAAQSQVDLTKANLPRSGSGRVRFLYFAIRNSKGVLASEIATGESFSIELSLNSSLNVGHLLYGFSFISSDGVELIGTTAHDSGMPTSLKAGFHSFKCRIEPNALLPGKYTIRAATFTTGEVFDHLDQIITFEVSSLVDPSSAGPSSHRVGYFYLPFCWEKI